MTDERLREIVRLLAQPGCRLVYDDEGTGGAICGQATNVLAEEVSFMGQHGWLKDMPSGGGAWLSDAGSKAFIRSTDELGDGRLVIADESGI